MEKVAFEKAPSKNLVMWQQKKGRSGQMSEPKEFQFLREAVEKCVAIMRCGKESVWKGLRDRKRKMQSVKGLVKPDQISEKAFGLPV